MLETTDLAELAETTPAQFGSRTIHELRELVLNDLFAFAWLIFGYKDLVPHVHGDICELLSRWGTPGYMRIMIQIPREFFKTSLITRANTMWQITRGYYLFEKDEAVVIFNERLDNPKKWIRSIKDVVQSNKLFQILFRDIMPPGIVDGENPPQRWKWSDEELMFRRHGYGNPESSVTGLGITAASTGGHWPTIIKDDIIGIDASRSPAVMEYAREWFDKSLYLERPAMKGKDLIVCTPWTYDDVYTHVLRTYDYKLYRRSAIEDGVSIFPEKISTEELLAQQYRDPYGFSAQMMCKPRPGRETGFEQEWLRFGAIQNDEFIIENSFYNANITELPDETPPRHVPLKWMSKVILFDPAPSEQSDKHKEQNARNALVVEGRDPWGRRFILESWADRVDPIDVLNQIFLLSERWSCDLLAVEEVVFSMLYRHWIRQESRRRKRHLRFLPLEPGRRAKDTRIAAKIPGCREGFYYWNRIGNAAFLQEYVEYPYGRTRDLLDAWAYDDCLTRPASTTEIEAGYRRQHGRWRTIDQQTGY